MATGFWTALVHRVAMRQTGAHLSQDVSEAAGDHALRLAGHLQPLDQMVTVRRGTLALVFAGGEPPRLQVPGDHLWPRMRANRNPTQVLVLNTAPVALDISIDELQTLDGVTIQDTLIRVRVQLTDDEGHWALLDLAADFPDDLESELLRRLHQEVLTGARSAVRMNRFDDVRRLTLAGLLAERWLPETFAGGALVRRDLEVIEPAPAVAPEVVDPLPPPSGEGSDPGFEVTLDPELARLWHEQATSELHGISGAQVLADCTVIAVPTAVPGAYESSRLQETFSGYYRDRGVHVISAPVGSYADLVRSWFTQVDSSPGRLVSVESTQDQTLRIAVDRELDVGSPADRKALRRLVPHHRIEFVAADATS